MNEITITDDMLRHCNTGNADNIENSLIYKLNGEDHYIVLQRCAENYFLLKGGTGRCVAERNIGEYTFIFYTPGLMTKIKFKKRTVFNFSKRRLLRGNRSKRFHALQKLLIECGFTSYDLS